MSSELEDAHTYVHLCTRACMHAHAIFIIIIGKISVKRQLFCFGDWFKMIIYEAWVTIVNVTTKGQVKPTLRVGFMMSAGENS